MIDPERFWRHVYFLDDSPETCWIWVGALRDDGRGRYFIGRREISAPRAAWQIRTGEPVPQGYRLRQEDHCAHPQCVRHWRLYRLLGAKEIETIRARVCGIAMLARQLSRSRMHLYRIRHDRTPGDRLGLE